jgi:hypothetical protein
MRFPILPLLAIVAASVLACGSDPTPVAASGSSSGTGAAPDAGASSGNACSFGITEGTTTTPWTGTARAQMNGAGNLAVQCTGRAGNATEDSTIELDFGNASFDGPRTYLADDFSTDGTLEYRPDAHSSYWSHAQGGKCALVLTAAPVDQYGTSVPTGSHITGGFTCSALVSDHGGLPTVQIQNGIVGATLEP